MSENKCVNSDSETERMSQNYGHLNDTTHDELMFKVEEIFDSIDDNFDPSELNGYLDALEEKSPLAVEFNVDASLEEFHKKYADLFENYTATEYTEKSKSNPGIIRSIIAALPKPKSKIIIYGLRVAATSLAMLLVFVSTVFVNAKNTDGIRTGVRWDDNFFSFGKGYQSTQSDILASEYINPDPRFDELIAALAEKNINAQVVPTWLPEEFEFLQCVTFDTSKISAVYANKNGELLSITVKPYTGDAVYEIEGDVDNFEINGVEYYLMTNLGEEMAVWVLDNIECCIAGPINKSVMRNIIESIYGV